MTTRGPYRHPAGSDPRQVQASRAAPLRRCRAGRQTPGSRSLTHPPSGSLVPGQPVLADEPRRRSTVQSCPYRAATCRVLGFVLREVLDLDGFSSMAATLGFASASAARALRRAGYRVPRPEVAPDRFQVAAASWRLRIPDDAMDTIRREPSPSSSPRGVAERLRLRPHDHRAAGIRQVQRVTPSSRCTLELRSYGSRPPDGVDVHTSVLLMESEVSPSRARRGGAECASETLRVDQVVDPELAEL